MALPIEVTFANDALILLMHLNKILNVIMSSNMALVALSFQLSYDHTNVAMDLS